MSQKVGKTWDFSGQQRKILYLEHGQNKLFHDVILPSWETKSFVSWQNTTAKSIVC